MKKIIIAALIAGTSFLSLNAANYAACAGCHGAKGEKKALGKSEPITGWDVERTVAALKGYKDGSYGGPMKGIMKGQVIRLSDEEIRDLAEQISKFK